MKNLFENFYPYSTDPITSGSPTLKFLQSPHFYPTSFHIILYNIRVHQL